MENNKTKNPKVLINELISRFKTAGVSEENIKYSEEIKKEGNDIVKGYARFSMLVDPTVLNTYKTYYDEVIQTDEIKKIEEETGTYLSCEKYHIEDIGMDKFAILVESNKGDYIDMKKPSISKIEEEGFFRTNNKRLYEEEADEYDRRRHL